MQLIKQIKQIPINAAAERSLSKYSWYFYHIWNFLKMNEKIILDLWK